MERLVRCSCVLSAVAVAVFVALVCSNGSREPWPALVPLRVIAVVSSAVAGMVGLIALVALDRRGRPGAALAVGGAAGVAGFPAFAVAFHMLFPSD